MFVTFEGIDGAGKSTQVELLEEFLRARGRTVVVAREPGGTPIGERIRELLLDGAEMCARAEASLFAAARAELLDRVVKPALEAGSDVILDRYLDSSLAYQGVARGLDFDRLHDWNLYMVQGVVPDRTFLLNLPAEDATLRGGTQLRLFAIEGRNGPPDRMERESLVFRRTVEEAYRELAERFPDRIVEIDAALSKKKTASIVSAHVRKLLRGDDRPGARRVHAPCL
jgi:dTMP kinase